MIKKFKPEYDLSIVIPIYNEEECIDKLYEAINSVVSQMQLSYEVILIDDGSKDRSFQLLKEIHRKNKNFKVIKFRKNFGQTAAMSAGIDYAKGKVIITMDADLQNDPKDIPMLLDKMKEGYDIVSGWRKNRKDKFISRRLPSMLANKLISKITGVKLHDYGCTLKAYDAQVLKSVNLYGELHRFIPAVANFVGVNVTEVVVNHHPRLYGQSKYGISRTFRVVLDLITVKFLLKYLPKPMQFFGKIGLYSLGASMFCALVTIGMRLFRNFDITGNPFFLLTILFALSGIQFISTGILGEMVSRVYYEGQSKTIYSVDTILDKAKNELVNNESLNEVATV